MAKPQEFEEANQCKIEMRRSIDEIHTRAEKLAKLLRQTEISRCCIQLVVPHGADSTVDPKARNTAKRKLDASELRPVELMRPAASFL
jgi:hypothetical protein